MDDPERYRRTKELFAVVRELPESERGKRLDRECGDDPGLRSEVEALLRSDQAVAGDALDAALLDDGAPGVRVGMALPRQIANYRVIGLCGSGGMGTVYEAEQDSPRRRVALKVIQSSALRSDLLRRFRREAEILGRLQHPGIAQIFDAGEFEEDGVRRPYFAMEFVEGDPLIDYADAHAFDVGQRLELFLRICEAVHYAHEHGVVHRDLKPDNVLVVASTGSTTASGSAVGQPKILDFGVARLTDQDVAVTLATYSGQLLGSVPYMSPEQAAGDPAGIDRRSDVYSLGVVLFELLTGRLPHDVRRRALPEAIDLILRGEPGRLGSNDPGLRGDLETIVGKCLEKDPGRRYPSVADLAEDVSLHQRNMPIRARPPSTWYQLTKFARRNRAVVGGVLGTISALVLGLVLAILFAVQASHSEELARASEERAERAAYRASMTAASALIEIDPIQARRTLDLVPEERRGWEWRHLDARLHTELLTFGEADGEVRVFDGGRRVVAFRDDRVGIWEPETGREVAILVTPAAVEHVDVDPAGTVLAAGLADGSLLVCDPRRAEQGAADWRTWLAPDPEGQRVEAIAVHPLDGRVAYQRGDEVGIGGPDAWTRRTLSAQWRHRSSLRFSGDGAILSHLNAYRVSLLDPETLEEALDYTGPQGGISQAISDDGRWLALGSEQRYIEVVDLHDPTQVITLRGHHDRVKDLEFGNDRTLLSISRDRTARIWDLRGERIIAVLPVGHGAGARLLGDGRLVTAGRGDLKLHGITQGGSRILGEHPSYVYEVAFCADGAWVASRDLHGGTRVHDANDGRALGAFQAGGEHGPMFCGGGRWLGFYGWGSQQAYDWITGNGVSLPQRTPLAQRVDSRGLVSVAGRHAVLAEVQGPGPNLWRVEYEQGADPRLFVGGTEVDLTGQADAVDLGPHPRFTLGYLDTFDSMDGSISEILVLAGELEERDVTDLEAYLATRARGVTAQLPTLSAGRLLAHYRAGSRSVELDDQSRVVRWRAEHGPDLEAGGYTRSAMGFRPASDQAPAAVESRGGPNVYRWLEGPLDEAADAEHLAVLWLGSLDRRGTPWSLGTYDQPLEAWEQRDTGRLRVSAATTYGPDPKAPRWVAPGFRDGGPLTVRDLATGRILARVEGRYHGRALHPDGTRLAAGLDTGAIDVFDTRTWERIARVEAHTTDVYSVDWSPDGTRLASGGNDNVIRIWDAATLGLLLELTDHTMYVKDLRFSPDGTMLLSGSGDRTVRLWDSLAPSERHRRSLAARALEQEVGPQVAAWRAQEPPGAVMDRIQEAWGHDPAQFRAATRVLVALD